MAKTAEQLMRSRYTAFVLADINYLLNSHHPKTRPTKERKQILKWAKSVHWMGLHIVSKKAGSESDSEGWVEFKASYIEDNFPGCIHENSYFVKENGKWFYKSGVHNE
jgi:SEC-C motif-containing protein